MSWRVVLLVLFVVLAEGAKAAVPDSVQEAFQQGCQSYEAGQYDDAVALWSGLTENGWQSSALYYNLGNAYFRTDELGRAILCYERALRFSPSDVDIKENLAFAYSRTDDHIDVMPQLFLSRWWGAIVGAMSARSWFAVCVVLACCVCAVAVVCVLSKRYAMRKWSLVSTVVLLGLWLSTMAITISGVKRGTSRSAAIVLVPMSVVKSAPQDDSVDKFMLHEGTRVEVLGDIGGWNKVRISDGNTGWMPTSDIEVI